MIGRLGVPELLIILVIVILMFGPGRLGNVAGELGKGIRAFRENLEGEPKTTTEEDAVEEETD